MSYTKFDYSDIQLSDTLLTKNGSIIAKVKVTNSGAYDGKEIVQLYIRDLVGSITRPVKELKGFQKVFLKKGESKWVEFELKEVDLKFYNSDLEWVAEPGEFHLFIGADSNIKRMKFFQYKP